MRKTLRTALGAMLGTVLVSATMAVSATPAFAGDCATAAPLGVEARTGTLDALTSQMWWTHDIDADHRVVSLATPAGSATLEVRDASCSTVLCTDRASAQETATCTLDRTGSVVIGVVGDATGIVVDGPFTFAYLVDVLDFVGGCNDGLDNDADGDTDWPDDAECTSALDNTEAPVHVGAYGSIAIETDAANRPRMTLTGVFVPAAGKFACWFDTAQVIEVVCTQVPDTEFLYVCSHMVVTAKAFSKSKPLGPGSAKGHVACDGGTLTTDEVDSSQSIEKTVAEADSYHPQVYLGTARVIRCRAMGVNGAEKATGAFTVDCAEPGVAWPVG